MLGRKQRTTNEDWLKAMASIEQAVTQKEIEELTAATVKDIQKHIKGINAAYAWSAGKDSLVLGHICEGAGVKSSLIGVCNLEYPAFMKWIEEHLPAGCEIVNTGQGLEWLAAHEKMLFPENSNVASRWFSIVQHTAQRRYCKQQNIDILLLGRRRADGNYVGKDGSNYYEDRNGFQRYSPLADWSHEQILAYIHYNQLAMPPIYDWYNGYLCGTHPWPARQWTGGNGWAEVYAIDADIVKNAADYLPSAAAFLKGVE